MRDNPIPRPPKMVHEMYKYFYEIEVIYVSAAGKIQTMIFISFSFSNHVKQ